MNQRQSLPAAIAAAILSATAAAPAAHADQGEQNQLNQESANSESAINDAWLDGKLESALLFNGHVNSFAIDTDVRSGVVYLSGTVESDIDRDLAGEIARSVGGVKDVKNDLVVDKAKAKAKATGAERSKSKDRDFRNTVADATHTAKVKTQLLANTNTSGLGIDVDTTDGVVVLSGKVASAEERSLAGKIAQNTSGTKSVDNKLAVVDDGEGA